MNNAVNVPAATLNELFDCFFECSECISVNYVKLFENYLNYLVNKKNMHRWWSQEFYNYDT